VPRQVELRSRHIKSGSAGLPFEKGRDTRGGLPLVTFLGRARKVTSRRAAPGLIYSSVCKPRIAGWYAETIVNVAVDAQSPRLQDPSS
jgi:hypothetical protein